ncbi:MAG: DUF4418 family protein [Syntrophomonadaceae bacterium]|nr:DUF4418 family protein [Syntrophomonadaceae bacterium]
MKKYLPKILLGLQLLASLLVLGAVFIWAPVCDGLLELKNGNMVHMKCFYTGQASVALAIVLFVTAIIAYLSKIDHRKVQWIVFLLGIMLISNTIDSVIGIGICKKVMACHDTAVWIKCSGIIAILSSLLGIGLNSNNP